MITGKPEIPCSSCASWNKKKKTFACNPNKCNKLAEWLKAHVQVGLMDNVEFEKPQLQYIV